MEFPYLSQVGGFVDPTNSLPKTKKYAQNQPKCQKARPTANLSTKQYRECAQTRKYLQDKHIKRVGAPFDPIDVI